MAELQAPANAPKAARDDGLLNTDGEAAAKAKENVALDKLDLQAMDDDLEEPKEKAVGDAADQPKKSRFALRLDLRALGRFIDPAAIAKIAALLVLAFGLGFGASAAQKILFTPSVEHQVMFPISFEGPPETVGPDTRAILIPIFWKSIAALGHNTRVHAAHYVSQDRRQPPSVLEEAMQGSTDQDIPPPPGIAHSDSPCRDCIPAGMGDLHNVSLF